MKKEQVTQRESGNGKGTVRSEKYGSINQTVTLLLLILSLFPVNLFIVIPLVCMKISHWLNHKMPIDCTAETLKRPESPFPKPEIQGSLAEELDSVQKVCGILQT